MRDYVHWATIGALCEFLPLWENSVSLADQKDRYGLPVAKFSYSQCDNDKRLVAAATSAMQEILQAAGASEVITIERYAHLVGGCRMSKRPEDGVVNADGRTWGIPNLYVTDGSVLPTQGAANPALTIMSLAARVADHLRLGARSGLRGPEAIPA
jgi:choline dehydrogenase-like flavoprotein